MTNHPQGADTFHSARRIRDRMLDDTRVRFCVCFPPLPSSEAGRGADLSDVYEQTISAAPQTEDAPGYYDRLCVWVESTAIWPASAAVVPFGAKLDPPDPAAVLEQFFTRDERERTTTCTVIYLGYPLQLSPSECRLVLCLCLPNNRTVCDNDAAECVPHDILRAALVGADGHPCSPAQVAVMVERVNRKAHDVSGRRLILGRRRVGYRLNPCL